MTDSQSFGKRRRTAEGRDARKREILEAAKGLFVEQGYEATSVSAIVRRAGVAQGTFYLYFDSKPAILVHLRGRILKDLLAEFERAVRAPGPADERLVAGIGALARVTKKNLALLTAVRQAASGEETEQVWIQGRAAFAAPLGALLREGAADGAFVVDDADMTAHLALALFDDLLYESLAFKTPAGPRKTQRLATRFLLTALGVPRARVDALVP